MKYTLLILTICSTILLASCGDNSPKRPLSTETMDSGTVEVFVDESYKFALDSVFAMYNERNSKVTLIVNYVNARNAVAQLLGGRTRVSIVGRDYLADEDSLMTQYNIKSYYQMDIANDGIVFFTQADFPLDTINTDILEQVFTQKKKFVDVVKYDFKSRDWNKHSSGDIYKNEPEFVIAEQNSSEYGNFLNLVCNRTPATHSLHLLGTSDSVLDYVKEHPNSIGICYLSQVQGKFFKILRVGYKDSTNKYIPASKPPHQSYIIMGEYPYTTLLRLYLLEDRKNLPFWLGAFLEKEAVSVQYYKSQRLAPSYAKYTLDDERRKK
ncbi:MAG: substrate-binding domain-containing protein [Ignavibacteria bacterium]|jgi:ABC-type phosphate transport system substrate-binding protein|nr:substrate-binding domain-containing protein [Ignavibacteria bacterium]